MLATFLERKLGNNNTKHPAPQHILRLPYLEVCQKICSPCGAHALISWALPHLHTRKEKKNDATNTRTHPHTAEEDGSLPHGNASVHSFLFGVYLFPCCKKKVAGLTLNFLPPPPLLLSPSSPLEYFFTPLCLHLLPSRCTAHPYSFFHHEVHLRPN